MKIILTQDVPRIGVKGVILDFASPYAMNSFVNKGLARLATANDEKRVMEKVEKRKEGKEQEKDKYIQVFSKLEKDTGVNPLVIKKKVDEKGHFYAKFSKHDVVEAVFAASKVSINESQIISEVQNITAISDQTIELNINNRKYKVLVKITK